MKFRIFKKNDRYYPQMESPNYVGSWLSVCGTDDVSFLTQKEAEECLEKARDKIGYAVKVWED